MSTYIIANNGELYHYGVKGMKWGVRRAQKRQAAKELRRDRQAYDRQRVADYNKLKSGVAETRKQQGVRAAYKQTRSKEYRNTKNARDRILIEAMLLTQKDRDRLYQDVKSGKNYQLSYLKRAGASTVKKSVVLSLAPASPVVQAAVQIGSVYTTSKRVQSLMSQSMSAIAEKR